jgi:hypothetical protein
MVAVLLFVVLGLPCGLYALLTRGQRRAMREIQAAATERGWRYRLPRWQGNPTAFRIDGQTGGGVTWILTSGNTRGYDRGWSVRMGLQFPALGGEVDLLILPRGPGGNGSVLRAPSLPAEMRARVTSRSSSVASAAGFLRSAQEMPSGLPAFDAAYQILAISGQTRERPLGAPFAERLLHWPAEAIHPHSMLVWRDPLGLVVQVRLPGPPNWATVSYFLALAEDFAERLPPPAVPPAPPGFVERLLARCLRS